MNPDHVIKKDLIKVMGYIDYESSNKTYMRIKSTKAFKRANLEG
jgi:hypothetical protein